MAHKKKLHIFKEEIIGQDLEMFSDEITVKEEMADLITSIKRKRNLTQKNPKPYQSSVCKRTFKTKWYAVAHENKILNHTQCDERKMKRMNSSKQTG